MPEMRRWGRVYSRGTAEGFQKMRTRGIPQPPLPIEMKVAEVVGSQYALMFRGLIKFLSEIADQYGFRMKNTDQGQVMVSDADPYSILARLRGLMGQRGPDVERLRKELNADLAKAEAEFLADLFGDAGGIMAEVLKEMELPKRKVFADRIEGLRLLYLDAAVERIAGEQDDLKAAFLGKIVDWVEGRTEELNVSKLMEEMKETSANRAKYFARDQFSRFNKALTVTTYQQAEAPYVEWVTVGDERVRPRKGGKTGPGDYHGLPLNDHRIRNHRIYTMRGLMDDPEYGAYLCRCGLVPHWRLTAAMERRLVA